MQDDRRTHGQDRIGDHTNGEPGVPRLVHLADVHDLQVADGDPDIRGWDVRTADGARIGMVKDLIIDTQHMRVRFFEARIDREVLGAGSDRCVLIPIGSARLDDDEDDVYLNATLVDPQSLPAYDRSLLHSREYEGALLDADRGRRPSS